MKQWIKLIVGFSLTFNLNIAQADSASMDAQKLEFITQVLHEYLQERGASVTYQTNESITLKLSPTLPAFVMPITVVNGVPVSIQIGSMPYNLIEKVNQYKAITQAHGISESTKAERVRELTIQFAAEQATTIIQEVRQFHLELANKNKIGAVEDERLLRAAANTEYIQDSKMTTFANAAMAAAVFAIGFVATAVTFPEVSKNIHYIGGISAGLIGWFVAELNTMKHLMRIARLDLMFMRMDMQKKKSKTRSRASLRTREGSPPIT